MWHILRTEPGAQLAIGFKEPLTEDRLRESALSGEIEDLLEWVTVKPGDTLFIPTGTVHAIGAGIALCEIQQMSDTTYRLYDYGRPRPLHLERSIDVATRGPWQGNQPTKQLSDGWTRLVTSPYFATDSRTISEPQAYQAQPDRFQILIPLNGEGTLNGQPYKPGEMWKLPQGTPPFELTPTTPTQFLRTYPSE